MNDKEILVKTVDLLEKISDKTTELLKVTTEIKEPTEGIVEVFEVTATIQFQTFWPPVDKEGKRPKWLWVKFVNDSDTIDAYCGVNEGSANTLRVKTRETQTIQFGNKKLIEYVNYKTLTGTANLRITFAR